MSEQTGESQQGPVGPRPNRRRPSRRRGGQRRPRENREPLSGPAPAIVPEANPGEEPLLSSAIETPAPLAQQPPAQIQQRQNRPQPRHPQPQQPHPRIQGSPIVEAIEQVEDVIRHLKESLRELEEVLEILDDAQRQQIGDEKEIEMLRRSLSSLQRARDSVRREPSREAFRQSPDEQRPSAEPVAE